MIKRCGWCSNDPLYIQYHDLEWGRPVQDEYALFEMLCLEGQQAGLSWITVLKKREAYRHHFFQFSISQIADFTDEQLAEKCQDAGLIRHIGKLKAIRGNAIAWLTLKDQGIDAVAWLWSFSPSPYLNRDVAHYRNLPAQTIESQLMSKALKKAGFSFIGPTICYAFMQAVGILNDHENDCHLKHLPLPLDKSKT